MQKSSIMKKTNVKVVRELTQVWIYTGEVVMTDDTRQALEQALPATVRHRQAGRPHCTRDRALLAYTALLTKAKAYVPNADEALCFTDRGKPYFVPENALYCSLSHTDTAIAIALSTQPVGVDVQTITPVREVVVNRVFTARERSAMAFVPPGEGARLFTRIWAQKEAALKKSGLGIAGLRHIPPAPGIYTIQEGADWVAAVCAEETAVIELRDIGEGI